MKEEGKVSERDDGQEASIIQQQYQHHVHQARSRANNANVAKENDTDKEVGDRNKRARESKSV